MGELAMEVVTNEQCSTVYQGIDDGMICAGGVEGESGCIGDSGGPLTYKSGDQHVLIGDVSWGNYCTNYTVYGGISFFRSWIESKMTSPSFCGAGPDAEPEESEEPEKPEEPEDPEEPGCRCGVEAVRRIVGG